MSIDKFVPGQHEQVNDPDKIVVKMIPGVEFDSTVTYQDVVIAHIGYRHIFAEYVDGTHSGPCSCGYTWEDHLKHVAWYEDLIKMPNYQNRYKSL